MSIVCMRGSFRSIPAVNIGSEACELWICRSLVATLRIIYFSFSAPSRRMEKYQRLSPQALSAPRHICVYFLRIVPRFISLTTDRGIYSWLQTQWSLKGPIHWPDSTSRSSTHLISMDWPASTCRPSYSVWGALLWSIYLVKSWNISLTRRFCLFKL